MIFYHDKLIKKKQQILIKYLQKKQHFVLSNHFLEKQNCKWVQWSQCSALHWAHFTKTTNSQSCNQNCSEIEHFSMSLSELFVSDASLIIFFIIWARLRWILLFWKTGEIRNNDFWVSLVVVWCNCHHVIVTLPQILTVITFNQN